MLQNEYADHRVHAFAYEECNALIREEKTADLLIVDIDTDNEIIMELIEWHKYKNTKVIVWTADPDKSRLENWFQEGLDGYFFNGMQPEELTAGINCVLNDDVYVHPKLSAILLHDYRKLSHKVAERPVGVLTEREWNVLELLTKGSSNDKIAKMLFITEKTVKNHVSSIFRKLGVTDRTNAVLYALRHRWFYL
ncbi:response regulator transcription factor [Virgibacillus senegalensis]|uniref:response regulator transcription factor n=1 Tax=Virgibacillus senegalensis TaxID=1499679 RepID=UPI000AB30838|nr:response regulator transcription factor [Virgibacillus senegalensis]